MATIHELCSTTDLGIFAIPYRAGRRQRPVRLPDGAIVEAPLPVERREAPDRPEGAFAVASGGVAATIHHANLGLIVAHLPLSGVFLLPSGQVAAIYGAEANPLGVEVETLPR